MDARVMRQLHILGEERDARRAEAEQRNEARATLAILLTGIARMKQAVPAGKLGPAHARYYNARRDVRAFAAAYQLTLPSDF